MKKLISFLICMSLLFALCIPSYAVSKTYAINVNGLSMTIGIPDHYIVYTDGIGVNEERLKEYGEIGEMVLQANSAGIVLEAWDGNTQTEIAVTCVNSTLGDYNQYSDTSLLGLSTAYESVLKQLGGEVYSSTVFQGAQAKFLKYVSIIPHQGGADGYDHLIQYNTAYGNQTVNITLHSYNGEPSEVTAAELEEIVRSSRFGANPVAAPEAEQTTSSVYTDKETGVSFTVPANWKETPLSKEREVLRAKFSSTEEAGLSMMYGYVDFYPVFHELGVFPGYLREEINQKAFTLQDMSILLSIAEAASEGDTKAPQVTGVQYGGIDYFKTVTEGDMEKYGLKFKSVTTNLYHFDKGYLHEFVFSGTEDSLYYQDFVTMVSSADFSSSDSTVASFTSGNNDLGTDADSSVYMPLPPGELQFGMTADQVHQILGSPIETEDTDNGVMEYFTDYAYRPLGYDKEELFRSDTQYFKNIVEFENVADRLEAVGYGFAVNVDISKDDSYLDELGDYHDLLTEYYGEPEERDSGEDDRLIYIWYDEKTLSYVNVEMDTKNVTTYYILHSFA